MRIDPRRLRNCLGQFATGVTVVTCHGSESPHGVTVNSFTAVSLEPPLVLISLGRASRASRYLETRPFTVNVLAAGQQHLALNFAGRPQHIAVPWQYDRFAPRLAGCVAYLCCVPWSSYDGGDHVLHLGEVRHVEFDGGEPLLFYRGRFRHLGHAFEGTPWIDSLDCPSGAGWFGPQQTVPEQATR